MIFLDDKDTETAIVARDSSRFSIGIKGIAISAQDFTDTMTRTIDDRPCDVMASADVDWGETDSLGNIPRTTKPGWLRALAMPDGDE